VPPVTTSLKDAENAFLRDDFDAVIINVGEINGRALLWMAPTVVLPPWAKKSPWQVHLSPPPGPPYQAYRALSALHLYAGSPDRPVSIRVAILQIQDIGTPGGKRVDQSASRRYGGYQRRWTGL
jgi:hypothetical protein